MNRDRAIALLAMGEKAWDVSDKGSRVWGGYKGVREGVRQVVGAAELQGGTEKMVMGTLTGIMGLFLIGKVIKK